MSNLTPGYERFLLQELTAERDNLRSQLEESRAAMDMLVASGTNLQSQLEEVQARSAPREWELLPEDLRTHLSDFRTAVEAMVQNSDPDDYWKYQLSVIARIQRQIEISGATINKLGEKTSGDGGRIADLRQQLEEAHTALDRAYAEIADLKRRVDRVEGNEIQDGYYAVLGGEGEYNEFETEAQALEKAKAEIDYWLDPADGWAEEVENIKVLKVLYCASEVNVQKRPSDDQLDEEGCDGEGYYWAYDSICEYKMLPGTRNASGGAK